MIPELGDNLTLFSATVAALMPALVAMVNRRSWGSEVKGLVAVIISLLLGAAAAYITGNVDGADVTRSILIIFFLGQAAYHYFWKPTHLGPSIEEATSPANTPR